MDFRLEVFLAVARNLSFTKASRELHISQPAITKHVQELENQYKVLLFNRQGGRIALTPEGRIFMGHAEYIIEQYKILQCEMNLCRSTVSGDLKIGADGVVAKELFDKVIHSFTERFPNIRLSFVMAGTREMEEAVAHGCLHLAIIEDKGSDIGVRILPETGLSPQAEAFLTLCSINVKKHRSR